MATVHREAIIEAAPDDVWGAVRDVGAVHVRLAPGFVVDTRVRDGVREVTFANGATVTETIVTIDDTARRLVYSASGGMSSHHNSSIQVFPGEDGHARLVWITDLLPDSVAEPVSRMVDQGCATMKATLEKR
jgi:hypothetical protein